jgi:hypothetical protein
MRLWTWQKEGFDIRDGNTPVESLKNSFFIKTADDPKHFEQAYTKLYEIVETDQFH